MNGLQDSLFFISKRLWILGETETETATEREREEDGTETIMESIYNTLHI